jgi:long-chain acyl-CoA synthetase
MTTSSFALALLCALPFAWLSFVFVRLGFPQRLMALLRMPSDLAGALEYASRRYGNRPLVELQDPMPWTDGGRCIWSASQILAQCEALSAAWAHLGLAHGERLAIYKANHFDLFLCAASTTRIGGIAVPINCNVPGVIAARYLERVGAAILVTDLAGYARLYQDAEVVPPASVRKVVITDAAGTPGLPAQVSDLAALFRRDLPRARVVACGPDDPLYVVHTSGTTGVPKGVILRAQGLIQSLRSALLFNFVSRRDTAYLALPLNHQVAQLYLYAVLLTGLRCVLNTDFDAHRILATIERRRPSLFFAFPITYTRMMAAGSRALALDSIRIWGTTADASHEVQQRAFVEKGCFFSGLGIPRKGSLFVDGLGSSEVGIAALLRIVTPWTTRFGRRVGRPTPLGPKLRVVDAAGKQVPRGQVGRLMIKGPCMFAGYWNAHDLMYGACRDGWWFTGDMVSIADDGEFIHVDREVDVMHTRHGIVYTLPIEEQVLKVKGVLDTCVFGIRDDDGCDRVVAVVALYDGATPRPAQQIRDEINALLGPAQQLQDLWVIPWPDFPLGATGKTLKRCLRESYGELARIAREQSGERACVSPG